MKFLGKLIVRVVLNASQLLLMEEFFGGTIVELKMSLLKVLYFKIRYQLMEK